MDAPETQAQRRLWDESAVPSLRGAPTEAVKKFLAERLDAAYEELTVFDTMGAQKFTKNQRGVMMRLLDGMFYAGANATVLALAGIWPGEGPAHREGEEETD